MIVGILVNIGLKNVLFYNISVFGDFGELHIAAGVILEKLPAEANALLVHAGGQVPLPVGLKIFSDLPGCEIQAAHLLRKYVL